MILRRLKQLAIGLLIFTTTLYALSTIQGRMLDIRDEAKLTDTIPIENAPPIVAFTTIALGGFRGLLADVLFLRTEAMKEREQFFELVQLASWIVKLQPRFTGATAFLAWNMAYNVSVNFRSHEDRWRWVQRGIELIRDEALVYNPSDPDLYKELGWIYQHKIGNILDDAHRYYKLQLMRQMQAASGYDERIDWQALADAPNDAEALAASLGQQRYNQLLTILRGYELNLDLVEVAFREAGDFQPADLKASLEKADLARPLALYYHSRWLRQVYKLEPEFVYQLIQEYGYLDFRLPEAHAIYWARQGLLHAPDGKHLNCERMVFQSLANAFKSGRLIYVSEYGIPFVGPNMEIADAVPRAYLETASRHENNRSIMSGYENLMKDMIVIMYAGGFRKRAAEGLAQLRREFPTNSQYRNVSIDAFALDELGKDISGKSQKQEESLIFQFLSDYFKALAIDDTERATMSLWIARQVEAIHNEGKSPDSRNWDRTAIQDVGNPELRMAVLRATLMQLPPDVGRHLLAQLGLTEDQVIQGTTQGTKLGEKTAP